MSDTLAWYDAHAARLAADYEALAPASARPWLADLLPAAPAVIVDVGAGTGRDAARFAADGYDVVAVEPSAEMRAEGQRLHAHPRLKWIADTLPGLLSVARAGVTADVVLASAVWQHVAPVDRARAFRKLVTLLGPGGVLALSLRNGPDDGRGAFPVDADEVERLARDHGMQAVRRTEADDALGWPEVRWTNMAFRLPDDGTGALPLLRHAIPTGYGVSDVALARTCRKLAVPLPPRGYWAKIQAGKKTRPRPPLPAAKDGPVRATVSPSPPHRPSWDEHPMVEACARSSSERASPRSRCPTDCIARILPSVRRRRARPWTGHTGASRPRRCPSASARRAWTVRSGSWTHWRRRWRSAATVRRLVTSLADRRRGRSQAPD